MTTEVQRLTVVTGERTPLQMSLRRLGSISAHALLIGASIIMLYPLLWMLAGSVRPENEIFTAGSLWPSSFSIDAYFRGWNGLRVGFGTSFTNSLIVSGLSIV